MVKSVLKKIREIIAFCYYLLAAPDWRFNKFPYLNKYKGKKAMVFGNGPSTKIVLDKSDKGDIEILQDSFFVNYAPLDPHFFKIKPKHYLLCDLVFARDTKDNRVEMTRRMYDLLEKEVEWDLSIYLGFMKREYCEELIKFSKIKNPLIHFVYLNKKTCPLLSSGFRHWLYKKGLFMPEEGSVVNTAIYIALIEGYKEIELYGVEHNMFLNLRMNEQHQLCIIHKNFYDKEEQLVPITLDGSFKQGKIHNYMSFIHTMFNSHYLLKQFADYLGAKIINCTPNSMIDVYEFKE